MKIIKSIDLKKNAPFQLIKEENGNNFYLVSIIFSNLSDDKYSCKTYIEVKKFDINMKILKKFKTKIIMPKYVDSDSYIDEEEESDSSYVNYYDHYCIYRCIVKDVKNYSFILHGYRGPPFEAEWFWTIYCTNGKIEKDEDKIYKYLSGDGQNLDLVFQKCNGENILAYTDVENDKIQFI